MHIKEMIFIVKIKPVIKWSGSKRSQSEAIVNLMPDEIHTYYESFIGGASVLYQLLHSDKKVEKYIYSDINEDLIKLWNEIKNNPKDLVKSYLNHWNELNKDDDLERKKKYFYHVRSIFNESHNPMDFLFISRTTTNGLIRYNKKGKFNNSFHVTRKGVKPNTLEEIIYDWSIKLRNNDVKFVHQSYENITTVKGDFLYLDPPYAGTKGMYYGSIDYDKLWSWMRKQGGDYFLSFDGKSGKEDRTYHIPTDIYSKHQYIYSGVSSFKRIREKGIQKVSESLYMA